MIKSSDKLVRINITKLFESLRKGKERSVELKYNIIKQYNKKGMKPYLLLELDGEPLCSDRELVFIHAVSDKIVQINSCKHEISSFLLSVEEAHIALEFL